jgi:von Willebrand factor type A domain
MRGSKRIAAASFASASAEPLVSPCGDEVRIRRPSRRENAWFCGAREPGTRVALQVFVNRHHILLVLGGSLAVVLTAACGGADDASIAAEKQGRESPATPGVLAPGADTPETDPSLASCATATADGALAPGNLVFMIDQSDSMGGKNKSSRWDPATKALKAFFADPTSAGFNASIQFFPIGNEGSQSYCGSSTYQAPRIALRPLPEAATFASSIDTTNFVTGTPTATALQGAVDYAKSTLAAHPDQKTVVILVTDGLPNNCGDSDSQALSKVIGIASANALAVPTYVIGVGGALSSLNAIAQAGGTQAAILASTASPAQTAADIQTALGKIRGATLSCDFALPKPPAGQTLDVNAVNVVVTVAGKPQTLTYDKDCAAGGGWHYDNPSAPTKVELCPAACNTAKNDHSAKISVAFGCTTKGGVPR